MDLSETGNSIIAFVNDNPLIAIIAGFFLLLIVFRKSKFIVVILCLAAALAAALYFISGVSSVGKAEKGKMIQKGVQQGADEKN
jgi:hypothetical protein